MIAAGDRVMVCLSGGKDSYTLLDVLLSLQRSAPIDFELIAVNLDQKQPDFPAEVLPNYLRALGVPFHVIEQDTYSVVKRVIPEGKTMCGLCSRLRRGALYRYAAENGITKIALGHHRDDIVETLFLNMFYGGRLKAMAPKLKSDDGRHIVIRPLAYVAESQIERYARARKFPIIPCKLCGSQDNAQRKEIKRMLAEWERSTPGRTESIFSALRNVETGAPGRSRGFRFPRSRCRTLRKPLAESYWVIETGCWPADTRAARSPKEAERRVGALLDAGFDTFIDLTEAGRAAALRPLSTRHVQYMRKPIPDHGVPRRSCAHGRDPGRARCGARGGPAHLRALPRRHRPHRHRGRLSPDRTRLVRRRGGDQLNELWRGNERSDTWPDVPGNRRAARLHPRLGREPDPMQAPDVLDAARTLARAVPGRAGRPGGRRCAGGAHAVPQTRQLRAPSATCWAADPSICRAAPGPTTRPWRCCWPKACSNARVSTRTTRCSVSRAGSARVTAAPPGNASGSRPTWRGRWRPRSTSASPSPARTTPSSSTRTRCPAWRPWSCISSPTPRPGGGQGGRGGARHGTGADGARLRAPACRHAPSGAVRPRQAGRAAPATRAVGHRDHPAGSAGDLRGVICAPHAAGNHRRWRRCRTGTGGGALGIPSAARPSARAPCWPRTWGATRMWSPQSTGNSPAPTMA